jgi:hypothetical protein
MTADIDHIVEDPSKLITELEAVANAKGTSGDRLSDHLETAAARLRNLVDAVHR